MVPAKSIVKHSQGLRNFSRGHEAEEIALRDFLKRGYKLKKRRYKIFSQEVDFVLQDPSGVFAIVEVKSVSDANFIDFIFSARQKNRYRQMITSLRERGLSIQFFLAVVDSKNQVSVIDSALEK